MLDRIRGAFGPAELLYVAGGVSAGVGVGLYHVGAGLAVVGVLLLAAAWLIR